MHTHSPLLKDQVGLLVDSLWVTMIDVPKQVSARVLPLPIQHSLSLVQWSHGSLSTNTQKERHCFQFTFNLQ